MLGLAVLSWRDAWRGSTRSKCGSERVAVVAAIGNEVLGLWQAAEHQVRSFVVAHLSFGQQQDDGTALAVANAVQLGVQTALGAPDTAGERRLFPQLGARPATLAVA